MPETTTMQRDDYLQVLRREGDALLAAAATAPAADVRGCPEWDMSDLLWHVAWVHNFWATVVGQRLTDPSSYVQPPRPDASALLSFAREQLDFAQRALTEPDPDTEVWTWTSDHSAAWITRRMAHETAVHRWDAEDAAGLDARIDPALASDGVDEFLSFFLFDKPVDGGSVHLHATDTPGEWLVRFGAGAPVVTREHAKGDAALRGPASDLILALWKRVPLDRLEVIGDATAVERLLAIGSFD
jgi:uncharacterized protein (TIGR03083 family)